MARPRRLKGISYNGCTAYFITSVTLNRVKAFSDLDFGHRAVRALLEAMLPPKALLFPRTV